MSAATTDVEIVNGPVRMYGQEVDAHFGEAADSLRVNGRIGLSRASLAAFEAGRIVGRTERARAKPVQLFIGGDEWELCQAAPVGPGQAQRGFCVDLQSRTLAVPAYDLQGLLQAFKAILSRQCGVEQAEPEPETIPTPEPTRRGKRRK